MREIPPCACSGVQKETFIKVGATAGLRLLPNGKADEILTAVKTHLLNYHFKIDNVSIIDGARPRVCSWMTVMDRERIGVRHIFVAMLVMPQKLARIVQSPRVKPELCDEWLMELQGRMKGALRG